MQLAIRESWLCLLFGDGTHDGLGDSLADGVDLGSVTTTGDADADVDIGCTCSQFQLRSDSGSGRERTELVEAEDQERLVDLEAQDGRLNERERLAVDLDKTLSGLAVGDGSRGLLLAEALDALRGGHCC